MYPFLESAVEISVEAKGQNRIELEQIERKYQIVFPDVLRNYQIDHNGARIKLCIISKGETQYEVSRIIPLSGEGLTFEKIVDNDREDGFVSTDLYPLASNRGGDLYYWSIKDNGVYLLYADDIEHPITICQDVSTFFEFLRQCA